MKTLLLQLTLTGLTEEDAGDYSCLLLTVAGGQVDKGNGSVTLQVLIAELKNVKQTNICGVCVRAC